MQTSTKQSSQETNSILPDQKGRTGILCLVTFLLWAENACCKPTIPVAHPTLHTVGWNADSGMGSLRDAIIRANQSPGVDVINFDLPSGATRIELKTPLPPIRNGVTINGFNKSGGRAELDGSRAGPDANGLKIIGTRNTIQGLVIRSFQRHGILISKEPAANNANVEYSAGKPKGKIQQTLKQFVWENQVLDNFIGITSIKTKKLGNEGDGIYVDLNSRNVLIKGNHIAFNQNGVNLPNGENPPVGIRITDNLIYSNRGLGIDLGNDGRTPNDAHLGDPTGPNNWQTFPVLRVVKITNTTDRRIGNGFLPGGHIASLSSAMTVTINVELNNATIETPYIFNLYMCTGCNRLCPNCKNVCPLLCPDVIKGDVVECEPLIISESATQPYTTDSKGHLSFNYPATLPNGFSGVIFAHAIRQLNGNTSEFSDCVPVP